MYVENLPISKTILDHETTINDLYLHTVSYIDNIKDIDAVDKANLEKLKTIYKNSRVNLIPKEVDKELSKQKLKSTGADRMHNEKVKKVVDKFDFKDKDKDYLEFDNHPLSDIESLMDPAKPAPWDHLVNTEDDEDIDIEIEERIKD